MLICSSLFNGTINASNYKKMDLEKDIFFLIADNSYDVEKIEEKYEVVETVARTSGNNLLSVKLSESEFNELSEDKKIKNIEKDNILVASKYKSLEKNNSNNIKYWSYDSINMHKDMKAVSNKKIKVAIIDSGINALKGIKVKKQIDLVPGIDDESSFFTDITGHGDGVAGVIASGENGAMQGICPDVVEIYSIKVLDENNSTPVSRVIEAINIARDEKVNIINMSFGMDQYSETLHETVRKANEEGILLISAAGNDCEKTKYPAAFDEVISVGATSCDGKISEFSANDENVDVVAPGEYIETTGAICETVICDGTSLAAAHVTAMAAQLWNRNIKKSNHFIRELICAGANRLEDTPKTNRGLIDYKYSSDVYDAVSQCDEKATNNSQLHQQVEELYDKNPNEVKIYNEAELKAQWRGHSDMVTNINSSATIMAKGASFPDWKSSGISGLVANPIWHGGAKQNSFANYRYIVKVGNALRSLSSDTTKSKIKSTINGVEKVTGQTTADYNTMKSDLCLDSVIDKLYSYSGTDKRSFVMGMGAHIATDMYAHSSYFYTQTYNLQAHRHNGYDYSDYRHSDNRGVNENARRFLAANRVLHNIYYRNKGTRSSDAILRDFYDKSNIEADKEALLPNIHYIQTSPPRTVYQEYATFKLENCYKKAVDAGITNEAILKVFKSIDIEK